MICLIKLTFSQLSIPKMSLVVFDIECIENNIVKELGIYENGTILSFSFLPPKNFKPTQQSHWCTQKLHGINWNAGLYPYEELESLIQSVMFRKTEYFAKGREECKIISDLLGDIVIDLDDLNCPKISQLAFKDEEGRYDYDCCIYPYIHAKTAHCAERKAYYYGKWTENFFKYL